MKNYRKTCATTLCLCLLIALTGCSTAEQPAGSEVAEAPAMGTAPETEEDVSPVDAGFEDDLFYGPVDAEEAVDVPDPFEPFNRAMFRFNDVTFTYVFRPIGQGYGAVVPDPVEMGIDNFFTNLRAPIRIVNSLLQGKVENAGQETGAFVINSIFGFGGILKASDDVFEEPIPEEDLGQTFGVWGIPDGPFLVLPFLGPTTIRDSVGNFGDNFLDPIYYLEEWELTWGARGAEFLNELPGLIEQYDALQRAAIDPYSALRDAYLKNRRREVER